MRHRPNIVLIMTDQQSADTLSCAGNSDLATPGIDSIAEGGTRFECAYTSFPLCTPARASMFAGLMPHEMGMRGNDAGIPEAMRHRELGVTLASAGYACAYAGKWHVPEIAIPDEIHGFRRIAGFDDYATTAACVEFLAQEHDSPFFLVASYDNPHNICEWAREQPLPWAPAIDYLEADCCPELPDNVRRTGTEPEAMVRVAASQPRIYGTPEYQDTRWWRNLRNAYFRLIEHADNEIRQVLDALRSSRYAEETVVLFTSDHGDSNGAHLLKQKSFLYDGPTRVPFIVTAPGARRSEVDGRHLVAANLDLYATILDYAGCRPPEETRGASVRPFVEGLEPEEWRDSVFSETAAGTDPQCAIEGRMVRTARYKYVAYSWGRFREQLFDMKADPGEMENLAYDPRFEAIRDEHRARLLSWCTETGDTFGMQHGHPGIPTVPGYEFGRSGRASDRASTEG